MGTQNCGKVEEYCLKYPNKPIPHLDATILHYVAVLKKCLTDFRLYVSFVECQQTHTRLCMMRMNMSCFISVEELVGM